MKTLRLLALATIFPALLHAQTATSDDTTATGSKVGTGAPIDVPSDVGPKTSPENPASGAIVAPPQNGGTTIPVTPADGGTGPGSTTQPTAPGTGMTSEGAGTGR